LLSKHNVDLACISQTHLIVIDKIKFNGYVTHLTVRPSGEVAIIFKTKIKQQVYLISLKALKAVTN